MSSQRTAPTLVDPIAAFVARRTKRKERPELLVAMAIDVTLRGGLALVETKRTYHNSESKPIEALLTFPVPVQAAFFGLTAKVGDRHLTGIAQKREAARETYEDAVDEGKTAVLHEELLRGVHSLSIGNLAADAKIEVTIRWAEVLRCTGTHGHLRIPMTVGDVYGSSGLLDVDELTHGGKALEVQLGVRHDAGSINLGDTTPAPAADGSLSVKVPSNRPIDLEVNDWKPGVLHGRGRRGRAVSMRIEPAGAGDENLDVAVLVDRSGSMSSLCSADRGPRETVHECVQHALFGLPEQLRQADRVALWQFDNKCEPLGRGLPVPPDELVELIDALEPPRGGTDIGKAIERVVRANSAPDLLLITDGLSYALDVQGLAKKGRRVFVVLVGEQSLEANVGHLAALTGGDVHFSYGEDLSTALRACVQGLRSKGEQPRFTGRSEPKSIRALRGNAVVEARWDADTERSELGMDPGAVAAYAAGLALGSMSKAAAMELAESEGLVTHLTSLVLVDEDADRSRELPTTRKVELPTPATAGIRPRMALRSESFLASRALPREKGQLFRRSIPRGSESFLASRTLPPTPAKQPHAFADEAMHSLEATPSEPPSIEDVAQSIDWRLHEDSLAHGALDGIDPKAARFIYEQAQGPGLREAGGLVQIDPVVLVIMCLAGLRSHESRDAEDVRRRLVGRVASAIHDALRAGLKSRIHRALVEEFGRHSALHGSFLAVLEPAIRRALRTELEPAILDVLRTEIERPAALHKALLAELKRNSGSGRRHGH